MKKTILLSGILSLITLLPVSYAGHEGGGGNPIESSFKNVSLDLASKLNKMLDPAKKKLKFDPDELEATLLAPNRFLPLCADWQTVARMKLEGKLARVYPETPNVVWLDCSEDSSEKWRELFANTEKPGNSMFFLHESLRILGREDENDYGASSSYLAAKREEEKLKRQLIYSLYFPTSGARCKIEMERDPHFYLDGAEWIISLKIDGNTVNNFSDSADRLGTKNKKEVARSNSYNYIMSNSTYYLGYYEMLTMALNSDSCRADVMGN